MSLFIPGGGFAPQSLWQNNPSMRSSLPQKNAPGALGAANKLALLLQQLDERKEALLEQRGKLVENTLARGGSMEDIEEPLKGFDEQMLELNRLTEDAISRYTQLQAENRKPAEKEKATLTDETTPTEDEPAERIHLLSGLSADLQNSKALVQTKGRVQSAAGVATAQLKNQELLLESRLSRLRVRQAGTAFGNNGSVRYKESAPESRYLSVGLRAYQKQLADIGREAKNQSTQLAKAASTNLQEVQQALESKDNQQDEPKKGQDMAAQLPV